MKPVAVVASTLAVLAVAGGLGGGFFVWSGWYDISATKEHTQVLYTVLEETMHRSVRLRAADLETPPLDAPASIARGAVCYRDKCLQCHGGPGVAQGDIGRSMQPLPGPLVDAANHWRPRELYWITKHGIKMSGMPAWQHRLPDADMWAVVAFLQRLPTYTVSEFKRAIDDGHGRCGAGEAVSDGRATAARGTTAAPDSVVAPATAAATAPPVSADRGRLILPQYACSACHRIPGVTGATVGVGPPLAGIATRQLIAGRLANTPQMMVRWIRAPQQIDPETTMPDMQVDERDARDMAAYLATLY